MPVFQPVFSAEAVVERYLNNAISARSLLRYAKARKISHLKVGGRVYFREADVNAFIAKSEVHTKET